jgi:hypothetical protein
VAYISNLVACDGVKVIDSPWLVAAPNLYPITGDKMKKTKVSIFWQNNNFSTIVEALSIEK